MDYRLKLIGFTLAGLFFKWVIMRWLVQQGVDAFDWLIKKYLGKYPQEIAIWMHFKHKRMDQGHQYPDPLLCIDGDCKLVQFPKSLPR